MADHLRTCSGKQSTDTGRLAAFRVASGKSVIDITPKGVSTRDGALILSAMEWQALLDASAKAGRVPAGYVKANPTPAPTPTPGPTPSPSGGPLLGAAVNSANLRG